MPIQRCRLLASCVEHFYAPYLTHFTVCTSAWSVCVGVRHLALVFPMPCRLRGRFSALRCTAAKRMEVLQCLMLAPCGADVCGMVHVHQEANTVLQEKKSALELSNRRLVDELKGEAKLA